VESSTRSSANSRCVMLVPGMYPSPDMIVDR
jgi:hypothetical protein